MHFSIFHILLLLSISLLMVKCHDSAELRCLICEVVVKEIENETRKVPQTQRVSIGGYSLDDKGDVKLKTIPLVHSEQYLSDLIDSICEKTMSNYVKVTDKVTHKLMLLNLGDSSSSSKFGDVDFVQDGDLNRSVEFLCKGIVEEFEEDVYKVFGRQSDNRVSEFCTDNTQLCTKLNDEL